MWSAAADEASLPHSTLLTIEFDAWRRWAGKKSTSASANATWEEDFHQAPATPSPPAIEYVEYNEQPVAA
jgi:hypothetical protein